MSVRAELGRAALDLNRISLPSMRELQIQRTRFGIPASDRVLLCVGRLEPAKEHALLLRAFAALHTELDDVTLLLVGRGRLEGQLRDLAAELGISHKVRFAGQMSNVAPAFHLADVFVLSSSREGMPLVVLEAMAAELPMVLTSVGGNPRDHRARKRRHLGATARRT